MCEEDLMLTLTWKELRTLIIEAVMSDKVQPESRVRLLAHLTEHWSNLVPRQEEFHSLEHRMRQCEREIDRQRMRIQDLRETMSHATNPALIALRLNHNKEE